MIDATRRCVTCILTAPLDCYPPWVANRLNTATCALPDVEVQCIPERWMYEDIGGVVLLAESWIQSSAVPMCRLSPGPLWKKWTIIA